MTDTTHAPDLACWVPGAAGHADWPIQNLPLGIADTGSGPRAVSRIGDWLIDLAGLAQAGLIDAAGGTLAQPTLNAFLAQGPAPRRALRARLSSLLSDEGQRAAVEPHLHPADDAAMRLPCAVGDYTDFYVGIHHATNVGRQFRPDNPLLPNYKYVPIGYHGRASSVVLSDTPVVRPNGQRKGPAEEVPSFGPSRRLDYELELGLWIGEGNALGAPVPITQAGERIAGFCLLNDWSARDLQGWEYQPLGPFLAKNFQTSVSPWLITPEALTPFRTALPARPAGDPEPLPYLDDPADRAAGGIAIHLEVLLETAAMRAVGTPPHRLSHGRADQAMYWSVAQIVAHHASNGCNLQPGDLIGTGTLSTAADEGRGSLLELSEGGKAPLALPGGETRSFLEDGDRLILKGWCEAPGAARIALGTCSGEVRPAP